MSEAIAFLKRLKYDYLNAPQQQKEGGTAKGYTSYVLEQLELRPDAFTNLFSSIVERASKNAWSIKVGKDSGPVIDMMLNGEPMPSEIVCIRPTATGELEKRTLMTNYAMVADFHSHCMISQKNANAVQAAVAKDWEKYEELLLRCNGDTQMQLGSLSDGMQSDDVA